MTDDKPLTQKAMAQLQALARGNNMNPEKIELVESIEETYALPATLKLVAHLDIKTRKSVGRSKSKKNKILGSLAELTAEIDKEKKELQEKPDWINLAAKELEEAPGHGWGHHGATIFWDKKATYLSAHENCPTCRGSGQSPCPTCQGIGNIHCTQCNGVGQENCILCMGTGQDPHNPSQPCPTCHGTRFSPCRFCQPISGILGRMLCPQCQGKANLPCTDCQGAGVFTQEVQLKKCATLEFTLGETTKVPSGLLRLLQRIGENNLSRHATITMTRANLEEGENPAVIHLTAQIPYADLKIRFKDKGHLVSVFGNKARLAGVPAFLDEALKESRKTLESVAKGKGSIEKAMTTRALQDALVLVLSGKTHPNELRRRYPVGLSADAAKEIMDNVALAIRNQTRQTRLIFGVVYSALVTGFYYNLFLTPLFANITQNWNPLATRGALVLLPLMVFGIGWLVMLFAVNQVLKNRFKKTQIGPAQPIGKVGHTILAALAAIYGMILHLAGII